MTPKASGQGPNPSFLSGLSQHCLSQSIFPPELERRGWCCDGGVAPLQESLGSIKVFSCVPYHLPNSHSLPAEHFGQIPWNLTYKTDKGRGLWLEDAGCEGILPGVFLTLLACQQPPGWRPLENHQKTTEVNSALGVRRSELEFLSSLWLSVGPGGSPFPFPNLSFHICNMTGLSPVVFKPYCWNSGNPSSN